MKLYSGPLSLFTAKVRIALREKGIPVERIEVPFGPQGYEPKHPEVARLNPKSQVPVLVDGDLVLTDSTVILEYLEDRTPEPPLYPAEPAAKAECRQLELFADEVFFPPVYTLILEVFYKPDGSGDAAAIAEARKQIAEHHAALDARLEGRDWFCGEFSVVDVTVYLVCLFSATLGLPVDAGHERLSAWLERAGARPSIAAEAAEMMGYQAKMPKG